MKDKNQEKLCQAYWDLMQRVQTDSEYISLQQRLAQLEPQYERILASLPEEERLTVELYLTCRENLDRRAIECACEELASPPSP